MAINQHKVSRWPPRLTWGVLGCNTLGCSPLKKPNPCTVCHSIKLSSKWIVDWGQAEQKVSGIGWIRQPFDPQSNSLSGTLEGVYFFRSFSKIKLFQLISISVICASLFTCNKIALLCACMVRGQKGEVAKQRSWRFWDQQSKDIIKHTNISSIFNRKKIQEQRLLHSRCYQNGMNWISWRIKKVLEVKDYEITSIPAIHTTLTGGTIVDCKCRNWWIFNNLSDKK